MPYVITAAEFAVVDLKLELFIKASILSLLAAQTLLFGADEGFVPGLAGTGRVAAALYRSVVSHKVIFTL